MGRFRDLASKPRAVADLLSKEAQGSRTVDAPNRACDPGIAVMTGTPSPPGGGVPPIPRGRRPLWLLLKLAVTIGLSGLIIALVDWTQFWEALESSRWWIVAAVFFLLVAGLVTSAYKWQQLLLVHDLPYPLRQLVRWYLVASFLNHFLPSSIGGDGYRIYRTWHNQRGKSAAVIAILVERITGMAALAILGCTAGLLLYAETRNALAGGMAGAGAVALAAAMGGVFLAVRLRLLDRLAVSGSWVRWLAGAVTFIRDFQRYPRKIGLVGVVSLAFHANKILAVWLLLVALGETVNPLQLAVALFAVEVAGLIPLSIGGLGLVEGSFMLTMTHFGVGYEVSLAAMLLMRVLVMPLSLLGAVLYFAGNRLETTTVADGRAALDRAPAHAN